MPARTDTGPFDTPTDLIDLIRGEPHAVEPGLRLVEEGLRTGEPGRIDLLGVDRHGVLTLLAVATPSPDDALIRLLDGYRWAFDQYALLTRVCAIDRVDPPDGPALSPNIRLLLLAPGFTHRFLRRLPLLTVPITALLARQVSLAEGSRFLVEPAAPLFGLRAEEIPARGRVSTANAPARREEHPPAEEPAWERVPAADMPAWEKIPSLHERRSGETPFTDRAMDDLQAETALEEAERTARERLGDVHSIDGSTASALTPADRELFTETLTLEEMEEFERFEHQRRGGDGGLE